MEKKLTWSKTGSHTAFIQDTLSQIPMWLATLLVTQEMSPCLCPIPISIWSIARDAICRGKSLQAELASQSLSVTNRELWRTSAVLCDCLPEVSPNASVSNSCSLPGYGPGLEPDRMVQSRLLPGKHGYRMSLGGTGSNWTAVPFYGSYNFGSN
jgi:hypothetical protein